MKTLEIPLDLAEALIQYIRQTPTGGLSFNVAYSLIERLQQGRMRETETSELKVERNEADSGTGNSDLPRGVEELQT